MFLRTHGASLTQGCVLVVPPQRPLGKEVNLLFFCWWKPLFASFLYWNVPYVTQRSIVCYIIISKMAFMYFPPSALYAVPMVLKHFYQERTHPSTPINQHKYKEAQYYIFGLCLRDKAWIRSFITRTVASISPSLTLSTFIFRLNKWYIQLQKAWMFEIRPEVQRYVAMEMLHRLVSLVGTGSFQKAADRCVAGSSSPPPTTTTIFPNPIQVDLTCTLKDNTKDPRPGVSNWQVWRENVL